MARADRVALITGTTSGIGRAVARAFLGAGYGVVGLSRGPVASEEDLAHNDRFRAVQGDVSVVADHERAVAVALGGFGRIDVFVGNAGIYDNRKPAATYGLTEAASAFDRLFAVNVRGCLVGALAARPALVESRGSVIFTSSVSGVIPGFGGALYVAAKHALIGLTRQLAYEWAPTIRVNAVAPGYVPTELASVQEAEADAPYTPPTAEARPLGAHGTAEDLAEAYLFLASDAASRLATGVVLGLDGGSSLFGAGRPRP